MNQLRLVMPQEEGQHSILSQTYDSMPFADVVLTCNDSSNQFQKPVAHKSVLASCSEFLKLLFESNPDSHEIIFPDVCTNTMISILTLIYTGQVCVASEKDISKIIGAIELLKISIIGELEVAHVVVAPPIPILQSNLSVGVNDDDVAGAGGIKQISPAVPVGLGQYESFEKSAEVQPETPVPEKKRVVKRYGGKKKNQNVPKTTTIAALEGTNGTLILEDADFQMITRENTDCSNRKGGEGQVGQDMAFWDQCDFFPQQYIDAAKKIAESAEGLLAKRRKLVCSASPSEIIGANANADVLDVDGDLSLPTMNYLFHFSQEENEIATDQNQKNENEHVELLKRSMSKDHSYATATHRKTEFI